MTAAVKLTSEKKRVEKTRTVAAAQSTPRLERTPRTLFSVLAELSRREAKESDPNRAYADRIAFVIQIMNREYAENHTLEDYAAMCKMSKFHFLRILKEITGTSPVEYKNNIRMEHALEFLEDGTTPIGEIAAQVGFSSAAYFCDAFKKKYGTSPTAYKKRRNY